MNSPPFQGVAPEGGGGLSTKHLPEGGGGYSTKHAPEERSSAIKLFLMNRLSP